MSLLQQLANIPNNSILAECIINGTMADVNAMTIKDGESELFYSKEELRLNILCEFIFKQGCDNDRMMREVVGNELYEACIDHHCQHIEISIL